MTRQLEQTSEEQTSKRHLALIRAVEFELVDSVGHAGGVLLGFSVKIETYETLVTLRAIVAGRRQVAFVGSATLMDALIKCVREAKADKLGWREDRFA